VIRARNASLFHPSIEKGCTAVRATIVEQTDASFFVAEQDKRFAENPDELCGSLLRELVGNAHWKPIPPQQLARRCSLPHAR
jgi:hypothetical protein